MRVPFLGAVPQQTRVNSHPNVSSAVKFGDKSVWDYEEMDVITNRAKTAISKDYRDFQDRLQEVKGHFISNIELAVNTERRTLFFATSAAAGVLGKAYIAQVKEGIEFKKLLQELLQSSSLLGEEGEAFMTRYNTDFTNMMDGFSNRMRPILNSQRSDANIGVAMVDPLFEHKAEFDKMVDRFEGVFQYL